MLRVLRAMVQFLKTSVMQVLSFLPSWNMSDSDSALSTSEASSRASISALL